MDESFVVSRISAFKGGVLSAMSFSKQPKTEKSQSGTWSIDEFDQCVSLIVKAKQRPGAFEAVMKRVNRIQSGHQVDALACGLADGDYASHCSLQQPRWYE